MLAGFLAFILPGRGGIRAGSNTFDRLWTNVRAAYTSEFGRKVDGLTQSVANASGELQAEVPVKLAEFKNSLESNLQGEKTLEACSTTHCHDLPRFTQVSLNRQVPLVSWPLNVCLNVCMPVTTAACPYTRTFRSA